MKVNREWVSISDMMAGLMMVFLFISVLFMHEIQKDQHFVKQIVSDYKNIQEELNKDLHKEFNKDLKRWKAKILKDNTLRFYSPQVLFRINSSRLKPVFKTILKNFLPRYLQILTSKKYKNKIQEIRIEGHTSSVWKYAQRSQAYLKNMQLSQERAGAVLKYSYGITPRYNKKWLELVLRANGMSSSNTIKIKNKENIRASQRVEFRVLTKAEEKIQEIIDRLD